jgi:hypothetical protein
VTTPTPDVPLLRKAVEWVEAEDAKDPADSAWYQGSWVTSDPLRSCGTAYCVAGYVGTLVDSRFENSAKNGGWLVDPAWVNDLHVSRVAQDALGLTDHQAEMLFDANNTAEDIRFFAEEIAGEPL